MRIILFKQNNVYSLVYETRSQYQSLTRKILAPFKNFDIADY